MKNRLRVLRAEYDWTQEDLANKLGISRQAVIAIEKEKYDPSLSLAFRIAQLFRKPVEEIFNADNAATHDPGNRVRSYSRKAKLQIVFPPESEGCLR